MNDLLKFITCGSVDDGKSTLIGHMLYDAKLIYTDQERALELDSRLGSRNGLLDYSLLLDGLMAEREQGITIDVAYRYFTTEKRSFIVADTPGHEEYTRNMAVGASFADLAVILIDASKGVQNQTMRHVRICNLMGIRHFIFAINKMDLIDYNQKKFEQIVEELRGVVTAYQIDTVYNIPVSATEGDNITSISTRMGWHQGKTLLEYLEDIEIKENSVSEKGFRLPIQRVCRPDQTFRGFQGQIESGTVLCGDEVRVLPNNETAHIVSIFVGDKNTEEGTAGCPVTVQLDKEVDISRGCVLVGGAETSVSNLFFARILWMDESELVPGKNYLVRIGTRTVPGVVMEIKYKVDINTGSPIPGDSLCKNEIADCKIALSEKVVYDRFNNCKALGGLIFIDRVSFMTSACGVILHDLYRGENLFWQKTDVTRQMRSGQKSQVPLTLWFTGLSGSGKTALASGLEKRLLMIGKHTMLLDGDNIRLGLNRNLGFTQKDRIENIRRVAEVAKLMNDAGLIVLTAFISPYEEERENARTIIGDNFIEIYVSTPLAICEKRDIKGLYKKARRGDLPNFTGVTSPYEAPKHSEITVDTSQGTLEENIEELMAALRPWLDLV